MNDFNIVTLTPDNFADYGVCGYKDVNKHKELKNKLDWFCKYFDKGLRIKVIMSKTGGYQGMIEYIPGEYAHRPVHARDYLFIHCIFVGFRSEYKGKGFASALIEECTNDAKAQNLMGVAVVTRKGSFMANKEIFIKHGFEMIEKAKPDFELLVNKFHPTAALPGFDNKSLNDYKKYDQGLTLFRSPQCPYTEKNVSAIIETAQKKFKLKTQLIDLKDHKAAQTTPSPFGSFCIIYNGEIISYHPISHTRFENIMDGYIKAEGRRQKAEVGKKL
jgi:ribosomal protein S18 acetylase RimI-like enzyme